MAYVNRALSFLLGAAIAFVGFVGAVETVSLGLGHNWVWFRGQRWVATLRTTHWSSTTAVVGCAAVAFIGLVLLVAEVKRAPRSLVELSIPVGAPDAGRARIAGAPDAGKASRVDQQWMVQRRSLEGRVVYVILDSTNCSTMHAALRYRKGEWRLELWGTGPDGIEEDVRRVARSAIESIGAPAPGRIGVRIRPERHRNDTPETATETAGTAA